MANLLVYVFKWYLRREDKDDIERRESSEPSDHMPSRDGATETPLESQNEKKEDGVDQHHPDTITKASSQ